MRRRRPRSPATHEAYEARLHFSGAAPERPGNAFPTRSGDTPAVKAIVVWLVILAPAFAGAALRETVLLPRIGRVRGLPLGGVILAEPVLAGA